MELTGQAALVTGGASGLGEATARQLAKGGAKVALLDLNVDLARTVAADIGGKVDILVNTTEHVRAGGLLDRQGTSVIRDEIDQSYLGFVHRAQACGPAMRLRGAAFGGRLSRY